MTRSGGGPVGVRTVFWTYGSAAGLRVTEFQTNCRSRVPRFGRVNHTQEIKLFVTPLSVLFESVAWGTTQRMFTKINPPVVCIGLFNLWQSDVMLLGCPTRPLR